MSLCIMHNTVICLSVQCDKLGSMANTINLCENLNIIIGKYVQEELAYLIVQTTQAAYFNSRNMSA